MKPSTNLPEHGMITVHKPLVVHNDQLVKDVRRCGKVPPAWLKSLIKTAITCCASNLSIARHLYDMGGVQ